MEVLNGIYRIIKPHFTEEEHGGCKSREEVYWFLTFYVATNFVGLYGSSKKDYRSYITKDFDYKGEFTIRDNNILEFSIFNRIKNENIFFFGYVLKNGRILKMRTFEESTPNKTWINDELFEWLDLDYEKLEKEFGE